MVRKINPDGLRHKLAALGVFTGILSAVFIANVARVAETPAAGAGARLSAFGPGALGAIRFELAKLGVGEPNLDQRLVQRALGSAPLSSDPFVASAFLGLLNNPKGSNGTEAALLVEAMRRDPRGRAARFLRLRQLAAKGELKPAFDELAALNRLSPGLVELLIKAIAQRISTPQQVDQALTAIGGHDELYLPLMAGINSNKQSAEVVVRFADRLPPQVLDNPVARKIMVARLIEVGAFNQARTLWQRDLPAANGSLVHAPDFSDLKAPPPFNWLYYVNTTGAAERGSDGRVSVFYYDRAAGPLLTQLLTLTPGRYRALIEFRHESGTAENVRLRVVCRGTLAILGDLPLMKGRPGELKIVVPGQGCAAQDISVVGVANQQRGETQVTISKINVVPAGGQ